jgi:peptidoglycan/xylan/chitin deacetylase (PgdA/CDA1 family)
MRNQTSFISFTFDDFPRNALTTGGAILKKYGATGTYYASLGLMGTEAPTGAIFLPKDVEPLLAQGHELGCHTFAHCHAWDTRPSVFKESIIKNKRALSEIVGGDLLKTSSYPISWPRPQNKKVISNYFACARGGGQTFNIGTIDLNDLQAYFLEKTRNYPQAAKDMVAQNSHANGWLIFATHDICDTPTPYGCTPEFFEDIVRCAANSGAKVMPVSKVLDALRAN